jgi:hypothetical protein
MAPYAYGEYSFVRWLLNEKILVIISAEIPIVRILILILIFLRSSEQIPGQHIV